MSVASSGLYESMTSGMRCISHSRPLFIVALPTWIALRTLWFAATAHANDGAEGVSGGNRHLDHAVLKTDTDTSDVVLVTNQSWVMNLE